MSGIPAFDPAAPRGPGYRAMQAFIRTRAGRELAINVAARIDPFLLRLSRGRAGMGLMMPTARLTSTGAKSGQPRDAAVLYFTQDEDVILIASNFGRERHPSWYHNLLSNPEAALERGGVSARYRAQLVLDEQERERLFRLATKVYAGYEDYRIRTAALGRTIPIFRLKLL